MYLSVKIREFIETINPMIGGLTFEEFSAHKESIR
jgi:hypothetical protein